MGQWKGDKGLNNTIRRVRFHNKYIIMLALFPKVPKIQRPKALKIDIFDYPTVIWRPLPRNPCEYPYKAYIERN